MQDNRCEQARLALALLDSLGLEGAIHACRANGWDGVLDFLTGPEVPKLRDCKQNTYRV